MVGLINMVFLKTKHYRVNVWKKTIRKTPYKNQKSADYRGRSNNLINTEVGVKGNRIQNLIKRHKFKVLK